MKRSTRFVAASSQGGVIAVGTYNGRIYPIPARIR
jgi:hypothetical protein